MQKNPINPFLVPGKRLQHISDFYTLKLQQFERSLSLKSDRYWIVQGEKMALTLFHAASQRVPAYKQFLKKHKINPRTIKTVQDFKKVPYTDKKNYLRTYSLQELCWDGKLENYTLFSVSSGSTGVPFFWPRGDNLELETSLGHALFLKNSFETDRYTTLVINTFSMGIYIAGVITLSACLRSSESGMPITVISPGIEIADVLRAIKELGQKYDQIILAGYPPFLKDILSEGDEQRIRWKNYNIKFLFATEGFTETFREYLLKRVGAKNTLKDSLNIYGSADAGILGHETPLSIHIRKLATKQRVVFDQLWQNKPFVPTFVQYNPAHKYFEEENSALLFSTYGGIPLVRYNIHDTGTIHQFRDVLSLPPIKRSVSKKLYTHSWRLPFLSVFGKTDLTISFYGLMIYPENIKLAIENKQIAHLVTGRFFLEKKERPNAEQTWEVTLELAKNVRAKKRLKKQVLMLVLESLQKYNLEYARLYSAIGQRAEPIIILVPYNSQKRFDKHLIKQRWTPPMHT